MWDPGQKPPACHAQNDNNNNNDNDGNDPPCTGDGVGMHAGAEACPASLVCDGGQSCAGQAMTGEMMQRLRMAGMWASGCKFNSNNGPGTRG